WRLVVATRDGRLPRFDSDDDFWRYVRRLVRRWLLDARRASSWRRRAGGGSRECEGSPRSAPRLLDQNLDDDADRFRASGAATPLERMAGEEEVERFLDRLGDERLRRVVVMRLDGWLLREIAHDVGTHVRTVRRMLRRAAELWGGWQRR
ncbi:MAG: ECF-type sigma factor, partial [Isosphaeraceae bacterium]